MLHCWCRIQLKSNVVCLSYENVYSGLLFAGHAVDSQTKRFITSLPQPHGYFNMHLVVGRRVNYLANVYCKVSLGFCSMINVA